MYPLGSILRYYPSTPIPVELLPVEPPAPTHPSYYGYYQYKKPKPKPVIDHYSAILLNKDDILQVKPTHKHFTTIEAWCAAMHERPASMDNLLDRARAIEDLELKKKKSHYTLRNETYKLNLIQSRIDSSNRRIAAIQDAIEEHKKHLQPVTPVSEPKSNK